MPDLVAVVQAGDRRASLEALRDHLAAQIDACESARDVAALAGRLTDVLAQIDALPKATEGTALDELTARRVTGGRVAATAARSRRG